MIKIEQTRDNGMFHRFEPLSVTRIEAAGILMLAEIAFGGRVTECAPGRISVTTNIMGCVDVSVFSGPPTEMALLLNCLELHAAARETDSVYWDGIARALRLSGGNPGVLSICPELLAFGRLARVSFLVVMGVTDPVEIKAALAVTDDQALVAALELREEAGGSLMEILS